jgi:hypothetical protein
MEWGFSALEIPHNDTWEYGTTGYLKEELFGLPTEKNQSLINPEFSRSMKGESSCFTIRTAVLFGLPTYQGKLETLLRSFWKQEILLSEI